MYRDTHPRNTFGDAVLLVTAESCNVSSFTIWCRESDIALCELHSCHEAVQKFARERFTLVFCDERLADGSWKDVFGHVVMLPDAPRFVVVLPSFGGAACAEVINLGAHDALHRPLDSDEMLHVAARAGLGSPVASVG